MHRPVALGIISFLFLTTTSLAGDKDYYLSVPAQGAIWKVDATTKIGAPFVTGIMIPHYGHFWPDGTLYMPDRGWPALLKMTPDGVTTALSAGGSFIKPVTCIPSLDGQALILSDMEANAIFRVGFDGSQVLIYDNTTAGGLLDWPDGLAYDDAGNLYVANLNGHTITKIDNKGVASLFADATLVNQPGGIAIDGAGNLFVANYGGSNIVRFRLDTGEGEIFAADITKMSHPNDLKLSRSGGLLTTTRQSNVCRLDAMGNITVEFNDPQLGEIVGISVPEDATLCSGRFYTEETGGAGSGGFVPKLRAIFSPCPGQIHGLELKDFPGGSTAFLLLGLGATNAQVAGIKLYVDLAQPYWLIPLPMPGTAAGEGDLRMQFTVPQMPEIVGLHLYYQAIALDPGASTGKVWSNRLHEVIGN